MNSMYTPIRKPGEAFQAAQSRAFTGTGLLMFLDLEPEIQDDS